ncbi:MAG: hypothetical protein K2X55_11805 [Burkholderiaceae bacterium]|nr:hypothetical protein [Burkholderiaceae bacterium]
MLKFRICAAVLAAYGLLHATAAGAQPVRTPVEQFAPLLRAALEAPDGAAYGVLTGRMATAIGSQFGTSAPIEIDVATLVRYEQPGCARLRVDVSQQAVKLMAAAAPQRQEIRFELNYCSDGLAPRSLAIRSAP